MIPKFSVYRSRHLAGFLPIMAMVLTAGVAVPSEAHARNVIQAIMDWNADIPKASRHDKYCKMGVTPFTFYRGSNHLYWADYAGDERLAAFGTPKTRIWLQGDLHVENFGAFDDAGSDIVYNVNDFDDSVIADYQLDLWRAATSMVLVMRLNNATADKTEFRKSDQRDVLDRFVDAYLDTMSTLVGNNDEETIKFTADTTKQPLKKFLQKTGRKKSRIKMLDKWTVSQDGTRKFRTDSPKLGKIDNQTRHAIEAGFPDYVGTLKTPPENSGEQFRIKDIATRLLAGTGSLGTHRYYVLIEGATKSGDDDRILDIKGQGLPTPIHFLGDRKKVFYQQTFVNDAARHQMAYLALTRETDPYLGWIMIDGADYSVRERSPFKATFDTSKLTDVKSFSKFAGMWGAVLAVAHARADRDAARNGVDPGLISYSVEKNITAATKGHRKTFRKQVATIAVDYADAVEADYDAFIRVLKPGDCSGIE